MVNNVTDSIKYVGVDDHDIDLFESQYIVSDGMAYNSYVILDEKTAVMDTVDASKTDEWLKNVREALGSRRLDYIVVQHIEPILIPAEDEFIKVNLDTLDPLKIKILPPLLTVFKAGSIAASAPDVINTASTPKSSVCDFIYFTVSFKSFELKAFIPFLFASSILSSIKSQP